VSSRAHLSRGAQAADSTGNKLQADNPAAAMLPEYHSYTTDVGAERIDGAKALAGGTHSHVCA